MAERVERQTDPPENSQKINLTFNVISLDQTGLRARGFVPHERMVQLNGLSVPVDRIEVETDPEDEEVIRGRWAVVNAGEISRAHHKRRNGAEEQWWWGYYVGTRIQDPNHLREIANRLSGAGYKTMAANWYGRASAGEVTETSKYLPADKVYIPLAAGLLVESGSAQTE